MSSLKKQKRTHNLLPPPLKAAAPTTYAGPPWYATGPNHHFFNRNLTEDELRHCTFSDDGSPDVISYHFLFTKAFFVFSYQARKVVLKWGQDNGIYGPFLS